MTINLTIIFFRIDRICFSGGLQKSVRIKASVIAVHRLLLSALNALVAVIVISLPALLDLNDSGSVA